MSAILAVSMAQQTMMKNNALNNMMHISNARMGLMSSPMQNISFGGLGAIAAMDCQMELNAITYGIQYQMARAMLESLKQLQKEEIKRFSIFA